MIFDLPTIPCLLIIIVWNFIPCLVYCNGEYTPTNKPAGASTESSSFSDSSLTTSRLLQSNSICENDDDVDVIDLGDELINVDALWIFRWLGRPAVVSRDRLNLFEEEVLNMYNTCNIGDDNDDGPIDDGTTMISTTTTPFFQVTAASASLFTNDPSHPDDPSFGYGSSNMFLEREFYIPVQISGVTNIKDFSSENQDSGTTDQGFFFYENEDDDNDNGNGSTTTTNAGFRNRLRRNIQTSESTVTANVTCQCGRPNKQSFLMELTSLVELEADLVTALDIGEFLPVSNDFDDGSGDGSTTNNRVCGPSTDDDGSDPSTTSSTTTTTLSSGISITVIGDVRLATNDNLNVFVQSLMNAYNEVNLWSGIVCDVSNGFRKMTTGRAFVDPASVIRNYSPDDDIDDGNDVDAINNDDGSRRLYVNSNMETNRQSLRSLQNDDGDGGDTDDSTGTTSTPVGTTASPAPMMETTMSPTSTTASPSTSTSSPTDTPSISINPTQAPSTSMNPTYAPSTSVAPTESTEPTSSAVPTVVSSTTPTVSIKPLSRPSSTPSWSPSISLQPSTQPSISAEPTLAPTMRGPDLYTILIQLEGECNGCDPETTNFFDSVPTNEEEEEEESVIDNNDDSSRRRRHRMLQKREEDPYLRASRQLLVDILFAENCYCDIDSIPGQGATTTDLVLEFWKDEFDLISSELFMGTDTFIDDFNSTSSFEEVRVFDCAPQLTEFVSFTFAEFTGNGLQLEATELTALEDSFLSSYNRRAAQVCDPLVRTLRRVEVIQVRIETDAPTTVPSTSAMPSVNPSAEPSTSILPSSLPSERPTTQQPQQEQQNSTMMPSNSPTTGGENNTTTNTTDMSVLNGIGRKLDEEPENEDEGQGTPTKEPTMEPTKKDVEEEEEPEDETTEHPTSTLSPSVTDTPTEGSTAAPTEHPTSTLPPSVTHSPTEAAPHDAVFTFFPTEVPTTKSADLFFLVFQITGVCNGCESDTSVFDQTLTGSRRSLAVQEHDFDFDFEAIIGEGPRTVQGKEGKCTCDLGTEDRGVDEEEFLDTYRQTVAEEELENVKSVKKVKKFRPKKTSSPTTSPIPTTMTVDTSEPTLLPSTYDDNDDNDGDDFMTLFPTIVEEDDIDFDDELIPTTEPYEFPEDDDLFPTTEPEGSEGTFSPTTQPEGSEGTFSPTTEPEGNFSPSSVPEGSEGTFAPTTQPENSEGTSNPTPDVTDVPGFFPTSPTDGPTFGPDNDFTFPPTGMPTIQPTMFPTQDPTRFPTINPTRFPTQSPTPLPTKNPTNAPSPQPTTCPVGKCAVAGSNAIAGGFSFVLFPEEKLKLDPNHPCSNSDDVNIDYWRFSLEESQETEISLPCCTTGLISVFKGCEQTDKVESVGNFGCEDDVNGVKVTGTEHSVTFMAEAGVPYFFTISNLQGGTCSPSTPTNVPNGPTPVADPPSAAPTSCPTGTCVVEGKNAISNLFSFDLELNNGVTLKTSTPCTSSSSSTTTTSTTYWRLDVESEGTIDINLPCCTTGTTTVYTGCGLESPRMSSGVAPCETIIDGITYTGTEQVVSFRGEVDETYFISFDQLQNDACSVAGTDPTKAPVTTTPNPTKAPVTTPNPTKAPVTTPDPTKAPVTTPNPTKAPVTTPTGNPTKAPVTTPNPTKAPVAADDTETPTFIPRNDGFPTFEPFNFDE